MKRFESGIYPVMPSLNIRLGDYGYWQGDQWCGLGNICTFSECPQVFTEYVSEFNREEEEFIGVTFESEVNAEAGVPVADASMKIKFDSDNSHYLKFNLRRIREYRSIEGEIFPFLKQLRDAKRWKLEYYLAYQIIESDKFYSFHTVNAGGEACVSASLKLNEIKTKASLKAYLRMSSPSIVSVTYVGDEPKFVGARFLSLVDSGFIKKEPTIKFNQGSISQIEY